MPFASRKYAAPFDPSMYLVDSRGIATVNPNWIPQLDYDIDRLERSCNHLEKRIEQAINYVLRRENAIN